jgi:hypothetical protein
MKNKKGGTSFISDVIRYGERERKKEPGRCLVIQSTDQVVVVVGGTCFRLGAPQRTISTRCPFVIALMVMDASGFLLTSLCVSTIF